MTYDEQALLSENVNYIKDKLRMEVTVRAVEDAKEPKEKDSAAMAQPCKPVIIFAPGAPLAKAAPKAKAGGGKSSPVLRETSPAKDAGKQSKVAVIKDMAKLNEHFSTRSYFEGGSGPTAADLAQLESMPAAVDKAKFPHATRWHNHISYFTPAQRSKW